MEVRWKLRMAAAQREIWTGAQLRRLLAERGGMEMSAASVSALMRQAPKQLKLSTLAALCVALDCQPGELIEVDTTPVAKPASRSKPAGNARRVANGARVPRRRSDDGGVCADCGHDGKLHARGRCQPCYCAPSASQRRRPARTAAGARSSRRPPRGRAAGVVCVAPAHASSRRHGAVDAAVELRRHAAHGLCNACYQRDPLIVGV